MVAGKIEVVEKHLVSKSGKPDGGEDRLILGSGFYGVCDGATDKSGLNWGTTEKPRKGGEVLADIVKSFFENTASSQYSPQEIVNELNKKVLAAARAAGIDLLVEKNRADVGFALYSVHHNKIFYIHDCNFGFILPETGFYPFHNDKRIDQVTSRIRSDIIRRLQAEGKEIYRGDGKDLGRETIMPLLENQMELQNDGFDDETLWRGTGIPRKELAYRTINGFPTVISVMDVLSEATQIVLSTDGFRVIRPTLEQTLAVHQRMIKEDPLCIGKLMSTKGLAPGQTSYDDQAYLRIRI